MTNGLGNALPSENNIPAKMSRPPFAQHWRALQTALIGVSVAVMATIANVQALPADQYGDLPEGITLELLAAAPGSLDQSREAETFLLRYTYQPGARLDLPYPGPLLVFVEEGTLTLEQVGSNVSVIPPVALNDQPLAEKQSRKKHRGNAMPIGERVELPAGGSAYAETGDLGPTSNEGSDELVLLVVQFVTDLRRDDVTRVSVPGTPGP